MLPPAASAASARVLLINFNRYDQPYPVYPLGLAYLDAALRSAGHVTHIWDVRAGDATLEASVRDFRPDFVGLSLRNIDNVQCHNPLSFVHELLDCCRRLRAQTTAPLILGGGGFSMFPRELLALTGVDYGIRGEGERALVRLLAALQARIPPDAIAGLVYRGADGAIRSNPCSASEKTFAAAPVHERAILQPYLARGALPGVQTQRGCPLRCCYCTYPLIEGKRSRYRNGEEVVAEMRRLLAQGVRYTFLVDSVFNTSSEHVVDVCEALARAELDMQWECFLRPSGLTRELLALMRRAGLRHIEFGSDSFSDPVLRRYGKGFQFAEIEAASRYAHELELNYSHFLIFGGPGETKETVKETMRRADTLPGAFYFATIGMRIYPETPLWRELAPEAQGESPADYLVEPRFYLAPGFTVASLLTRLREVQRTAYNWVVGDPPPAFVATMDKLRQRGVRGPMWEYVELLQRLASG
jgi:radical SAM superfamily enzyme YgiQ (UPF0313 family)